MCKVDCTSPRPPTALPYTLEEAARPAGAASHRVRSRVVVETTRQGGDVTILRSYPPFAAILPF